jgi:multidrug resistance protein
MDDKDLTTSGLPSRAGSEKSSEDDVASSIMHVSRNDQVAWHYLTFETDLPTPLCFTSQPTTHHDRSTPSRCPDLKKYTSPFLWSESRKTFTTWLSCTATLVTAYTAGSYAPGIPQMTEEWGISDVAAEVGITVFTCGFALAPMFLAPFSEINGRKPIFIITGVLFVVFQLTCGLTPTFAGMLIARFLAGCMSSTFSTLVGGVVSDIYNAKDRNTAMALFSGAAMCGTGLGPLISSILVTYTTWRWCFYLQVITDGVLMVFLIFLFKETRGSVLLSRKAKALNKWYDQLESEGHYGVVMPSADETSEQTVQRIRWKVLADEERGSIFQMIRISLWRPFYMLLTEPTVFFFSLWISFSWSVLYLTFGAIPLIFQTTYGFTTLQYGAVFSAISIASIAFTPITIFQERLLWPYLPEKHRKLLKTPEGRLYFCCFQSVLLPIGCVWFSVSGAYPGVPWIVPALGVGCATIGIFSVYLAVFNYLADSYHRYASSALAVQGCCRNLLGGAFPIFTRQLYTTLTFQGAGGFLGGVGLLLTIVPWVLLIWGPSIRARSKLAGEILAVPAKIAR